MNVLSHIHLSAVRTSKPTCFLKLLKLDEHRGWVFSISPAQQYYKQNTIILHNPRGIESVDGCLVLFREARHCCTGWVELKKTFTVAVFEPSICATDGQRTRVWVNTRNRIDQNWSQNQQRGSMSSSVNSGRLFAPTVIDTVWKGTREYGPIYMTTSCHVTKTLYRWGNWIPWLKHWLVHWVT